MDGDEEFEVDRDFMIHSPDNLEFSELNFKPFITPKNFDKIEFNSGIDKNFTSLIKTIEKVKPQIFEEQIIINERKKVLNEIRIDRLYTKDEEKTIKNRPSPYSASEIKKFARDLDIVIGKKKRDELIIEIREMAANNINSS